MTTKAQLEARVLELETALRTIVEIGGNLPDDRLTDRTGPNDAAQRGLMYCHARQVAVHHLPVAVEEDTTQLATVNLGRETVGVGMQYMKVGDIFTTQASDDWYVGQEMTTWADYKVKVVLKELTGIFGSWKYKYSFQVIAAGKLAQKRALRFS